MKKIHFEEIDSTNTYLKKNYQTFENYTFVSADNQTDGHGRNKRKWYSDSNNLQFSLLIKDQEVIKHYKAVSLISAYAIIKVLEQYGLNNLSIKWPNDLYANGLKIGGILLESISTNQLDCLIVGIGLNVNQKIFKNDYLFPPTSIFNQIHLKINLDELKNKIYLSLINHLNNLDQDYYSLIKEYDYLINRDVYAFINNQKELVNVIGINKDFSLKVKSNNQIYNLETDEISFHI